MKVISRAEAKKQGLNQYFTSVPCKRGHTSVRYTINGVCRECSLADKKEAYPARRDHHIAYMKDYRKQNEDRLSAYDRQYYQENKLELREKSRMYYAEFVEYYRDYNKQYYQNNIEYFEQHNREYYRDNLDYFVAYWAENADKYNASSAKRRAIIKQALPLWAELDQIQDMYRLSKQISMDTSLNHEVDHIVPLAGELVCGLHCIDNLQILLETDNKKKSNKFSTDA